MKRKKLIASLAGLTAVFALAAAGVEWAGYHILDRKDGGENPLCTMDPTCRSLTEGEIDLARSVFGEAIDYRNVKIFHRNYFGFIHHGQRILSPNGNIYIPQDRVWSEDYSTGDAWDKGVFIHEMTHVWQAQTGKTIPTEALDNLIAYDFNYQSSYNYTLNEHALFSDYNIEQQASMTEDYIDQRTSFEEMISSPLIDAARYSAEKCPDLKRLEAKIAQVLPLQKLEACPENPPPVGKRQPKGRHLKRH